MSSNKFMYTSNVSMIQFRHVHKPVGNQKVTIGLLQNIGLRIIRSSRLGYVL